MPQTMDKQTYLYGCILTGLLANPNRDGDIQPIVRAAQLTQIALKELAKLEADSKLKMPVY